jgi:hypothetical protein
MQDIERAQLKGDASEEELKALEIDVTGKIMLASWRGTRFEVVQVLREVRVSILISFPFSLNVCPPHAGSRQCPEGTRRERSGAVPPRKGALAPRRDLQEYHPG